MQECSPKKFPSKVEYRDKTSGNEIVMLYFMAPGTHFLESVLEIVTWCYSGPIMKEIETIFRDRNLSLINVLWVKAG